jgi:RNA 2',3'-cyclic 3'-phosphodiesterase
MMRVFFGIELDATTALQVADWRDRQVACTGQMVPPANFHITLAFIGPLSEPAIERLCLAVAEWLPRSAVTGATLHLDRTGYWHKPGIYWLGPTTWPEHLTRLAQKLNHLASAVGAKRDRNPFQPHITLYRRCTAAPPATHLPPSIDMTYRHCALFESRQGKQGVSYHVLQDWELPVAMN